MIYGYIRVSTDKQTVENQRFEINKFLKNIGTSDALLYLNEMHTNRKNFSNDEIEKAKHLKVDGWIEETISGTKAYNKRALGRLLEKIKKNDIIVCAELSRLGRNLFMIMEILNICMTKECRVWTIKDNYRLGDDIQSKVLAFAFGLSAEIERNLISQRTKEALARKREEGVILGRPKGKKTRIECHPCYKKHSIIVEGLENNLSYRTIAKLVGCDRGTLRAYLNRFGLQSTYYKKHVNEYINRGCNVPECFIKQN